MNFDDAIKAHAQWKMKLMLYLKNPNGSLNANEVAQDNQCELGKWIYASAGKYSSDTFKLLKETHNDFHKCAAKIIIDADSGKNRSEEIALGSNSEYATLSSDIVQNIMAMKKEIE